MLVTNCDAVGHALGSPLGCGALCDIYLLQGYIVTHTSQFVESRDSWATQASLQCYKLMESDLVTGDLHSMLFRKCVC